MSKFLCISLFLILTNIALSQASDNPPAKGFNIKDSDPKAIQIADQVMNSLGGRKNWDNTHYICWNFFGARYHIWDKWSGRLRFEEKDLIVLLNLNTRSGRAWQQGREITQPDSLKKRLDHAYAAWINDGYWMFMPYKLKDTGVTLQYKGDGMTIEKRPTGILQLTFKDVGLTPNNKYYVYVDKESKLVTQFDYFRDASDAKPTIQAPWKDWKKYGNILLSDDRGNRKMTDIAVFAELPQKVFESSEHIDLGELIKKYGMK